MVKIFSYIFFFFLIKLSFTIVPLWNFDKSAIELFAYAYPKEHTYDVVDKELLGLKYKLTRKFYIKDGKINKENYLYIEGTLYGMPEYDDIQSAYKYGNYYYVCPKGKNDVRKITISENVTVILREGGVNDEDIYERKYLFIFYLGTKNNLYEYYLEGNGFKYNMDINDGIYAYRWRVSGFFDGDPTRQMFAVVKQNNKIYLKDIHIKVYDNSNFDRLYINQTELGDIKSDFIAFFNSTTYDFFWINYNINNITDFESGYHNKGIEKPNYVNLSSFDFVINKKSPFEFFDNVSITKIKFLHDNIAYFKLYNNDKKIYYHGILDIVQNKVIFNTDKDIKEFYPYLTNSLLAITDESIYKICLVKFWNNNNNKFDCTENCEYNDKRIYNTIEFNNCNNNCHTNLFLEPNHICIEACDENLFVKKDNGCWLCKDLDINNKYKLVNSSGCLPEKIENSDFVNENLYLIECKAGYIYINNKCLKCHPNCEKCTESSDSDEHQQCSICKDVNYFLQDGNCVSKCSNDFFVNGKNCEKCNNLCLTCENNKDNCKTCEKGKYLDNTNSDINTCKNCINECETCQKGEDGNIECLTCNKNSNFTILFNKTCIDKCPENMTEENFKCVIKNDDSQNDQNQNSKIILWIYILICGFSLIIILYCFYRRICFSKNFKDNIIEKINTELILN